MIMAEKLPNRSTITFASTSSLDSTSSNRKSEEYYSFLLETPFQFYRRLSLDNANITIQECLEVISMLDTAFKSVSEFLSSVATLRYRESRARSSSEGGVEKMKKSSGTPQQFIENLSDIEKKAEDIISKHLSASKYIYQIIYPRQKEIINVNQESGTIIISVTALDCQNNVITGTSYGSSFVIAKPSRCFIQKSKQSSEIGGFSFKDVELSGFLLYGCQTELFLALRGHGVQSFNLDCDFGLFISKEGKVSIPMNASFYSCNGAYSEQSPYQIRAYLNIAAERGPLEYFWTGGYLSQLSGILLRGGIFFEFFSGESSQIPLLSVAYSVALIMEEGGGSCFPISNGLRETDFYQYQTNDPFQNIGICFGSYDDVELLKSIYLQEVVLPKSYYEATL